MPEMAGHKSLQKPAGLVIRYPIEAEHYEHHHMTILSVAEGRPAGVAGTGTCMHGDEARR
jgi:hypothetical protein